MATFIKEKTSEVPVIVIGINEDKSNIKDFYVADVHQGRSFLLNDGGYPMNDVDAIIRQQNDVIRESMLNSLAEVPTTGVPSDTPNEEVLMSLKSRYQQAPSELVKFYEKQLEIAESKRAAEKSSEEVIESSVEEVIDNV